MGIKKETGLVILAAFMAAAVSMGCASAQRLSPEAQQIQQEAARQFAQEQSLVASKVDLYPNLTNVAVPRFNSNGFSARVFGYAQGKSQYFGLKRNDFNGTYRQWDDRNDRCIHFSLDLNYNFLNARQSCRGKIFEGNGRVYEFSAEFYVRGKRIEATNDPESYFGKSMMQICIRAANAIRAYVEKNKHRFPIPRIGF